MSRSVRTAIASILLLANADRALAKHPDITLDWVGIYEMNLCRAPPDKGRFAAAKIEAEQRLPEFQQAWSSYGPRWLDETAKLVGRPFKFNEALATLIVCQDHPWGTSYPLTANLEWFLSAHNGKYRHDPRWQELFAERVYHEVLHRYIRDLLGLGTGVPFRETPLMHRYAAEPLLTRTHLHVVAIERVLFQRLGKADFPPLLRSDHQHAPAYARAYEIVDEVGAEAVIEDLRQAAGAQH